MSGLEWITQIAQTGVPVLTSAVVTSAIYDFGKHLLKKTRKRKYYAKTLKKTFRDIAEELKPAFWSDGTILERVHFQQRLVECLQSPEIDKDKFLNVLKEEGISKKSAEKIFRRVIDEFIALVDEEAAKNPKVFMGIMLNAAKKQGAQMSRITEDLQSLRKEIPRIVHLVSEANRPQLDRIERKIEIANADLPNFPTIQSVLRKDEILEGEFFRKEPAWVDFEKGFIVKRKEVDDIISDLEMCNFRLILGGPAAGKSVVLKNVGFVLANNKQRVYVIEFKRNSLSQLGRYFRQILRMKEESFVLIIDDAHLQLSTCERLIRELRNAESKVKIIIGSRSIEEKSPKETSEFEYLRKSTLFAKDATKGIIELFLKEKYSLSNDRIRKASKELSKYGTDLWHLSWALKSFDPGKDSVEENQIYEKVKDSIRNMSKGVDDALFPLSVFYQYEVPISRSFLEEQLGLEEELISQLIDQSEIVQNEQMGTRRSLSLHHSSIAKIYLETYRRYPSLGRKVKKLLKEDDEKYSLFHWYMTTSDVTNYLDILHHLLNDDENGNGGWTLIIRLFEDEWVKSSFGKIIQKEKNLERITEFLRDLAFASTEERPQLTKLKRQLAQSVLGSEFPQLISSETLRKADAKRFGEFLRWLGFSVCYITPSTSKYQEYVLSLLSFNDLVRKFDQVENVDEIAVYLCELGEVDLKLASLLIESADFDNLLTKIQGERDMSKVLTCLYSVYGTNEKIGLAIARKIDFSGITESDVWLAHYHNPRFLKKMANFPSVDPKIRLLCREFVKSYRQVQLGELSRNSQEELDH